MIKNLVAIYILIFSFANAAQAQTLPAKVKDHLNISYAGWKIQPTRSNCGSGKSVVTGDFNNDRKTDYAVKIQRGKRGYIIAFVARKNDYAPFVLYNLPAAELKDMTLIIYRKGEKYYKEMGEESSAIKLKADALYDVPCESDNGLLHVFRKGKFAAL